MRNYDQEWLESQVSKYHQEAIDAAMNRKRFCKACSNESLGVKSRISVPHSCDAVERELFENLKSCSNDSH